MKELNTKALNGITGGLPSGVVSILKRIDAYLDKHAEGSPLDKILDRILDTPPPRK